MLEIIHSPATHSPPRAIVFDFDGTVSLIRAGWARIMSDLMVDGLAATASGESESDLRSLTQHYIAELTGLPSVHQFNRYCEELQKRGTTPEPVEFYLDEYHRRLLAEADRRKDDVRSGRTPPDEWTVPGTRNLLEALRDRGIELTLASGTYVDDVIEEAELLQLTPFFEDRIFGPRGDHCGFTKFGVMQAVIEQHSLDGPDLAAFGDGQVEIENARTLGATAVAVASDELNRNGRPDEIKRTQLIAAGAHAVVPDYRDPQPLLDWLGL